MKALLHKLFDHLASEHPEHIIFYFISSFVMMSLLIRYDKEIKNGLKGSNLMLEAPESMMLIFIWITPQVIFAVLFLELNPPEYLWWFMLLGLLFCLAGKEGIQMLFSFGKGRTTIIEREKSTSETTETVKKETNE